MDEPPALSIVLFVKDGNLTTGSEVEDVLAAHVVAL
jgi:hypothetical protein